MGANQICTGQDQVAQQQPKGFVSKPKDLQQLPSQTMPSLQFPGPHPPEKDYLSGTCSRLMRVASFVFICCEQSTSSTAKYDGFKWHAIGHRRTRWKFMKFQALQSQTRVENLQWKTLGNGWAMASSLDSHLSSRSCGGISRKKIAILKHWK